MKDNNIFKDAKFGDKFLTKCGKTALFYGIINHFPILIIDGLKQFVKYFLNGYPVDYQDSFISDNSNIDKYNIVSRYQEPIDEDKLDIYAHCADSEYMKSIGKVPVNHDYYLGFKAGYRKAME